MSDKTTTGQTGTLEASLDEACFIISTIPSNTSEKKIKKIYDSHWNKVLARFTALPYLRKSDILLNTLG
jgi:hypothetical protein